MSLVIDVLGWTAFVFGAAGAAYAILAARVVGRFAADAARAGAAPEVFADTVAILKPLHGAEPGLRQNLDSFYSEGRGGGVSIIFGLHDADDPTRPMVEALIGDHGGVASRLVVSPKIHGENRKVSNLINMSEALSADVIVLSDSDISAPEGYLRRVVAALNAPGVGIVTCPYIGRGQGGFFARLAAMGISYQFLPSVLLGVGLGLARPCMGSTIALRSETLKAVGGFQAFRNVLADDYALGAAVRATGQASALAPVLVAHDCTETSFADLLAHEGRWAATVRGVDPVGHAGSLLTHPLPLALIALALLGATPATFCLLSTTLLTRAFVKWTVDRAGGEAAGAFWLLPVRDIVSFLVFARSFFARSVEWRGEKFHVTQSGDLRPV